MGVDFKTFRSVAPFVIDVRKPILIRGRHGVGKSEVVYQLAHDLGLPVVERRASQMTEGDLLGMPSPEAVEVNGQQGSKFNPFEWFLRACTEPVCLFLDEVDRATTEVRQGIFELTDSRKIAGWVLHPDTIVVSAVNGGEHASQYQVNEMDPAELDRYTVFDIEPTVEDWLEWGNDNVNSIMWDFINQNRQHLEHTDDYEPNKVYPSRRSWKRLNDCLEQGKLFEESADEGVFFNLSQAFCGLEAAVAFLDFYKAYDRQVTWEQVVNDGQVEKTEAFDINEHSALVEKIEHAGILSERLSDEQVANLADYFEKLPAEIAMKLWSAVGKGASSGDDAEVTKDNIVRFHSKVQNSLMKLLGQGAE
tara:strand:- start:128 stop:1216 length:1089 start_codon:yes stop_codon:yes gene_type:complete